MQDPVKQGAFLDYLLLLLRQFAGGPGPIENNLMRFGLPMVLWAALIWVAWSRRKMTQARERMLIWGFFFGFLREAFMFIHISLQIILGHASESGASAMLEPLEHALSMLAVVVVAGAFMRYFSSETRTAHRYLVAGVGLTLISYLATAPWWHVYIVSHPTVKFHQTWAAWVFHVTASAAILVAMVYLMKRRHWLAHVVTLALLFAFLSESIMLSNFATNKQYAALICPIGNTLHFLVVPILGFVYLREQALERQRLSVQLDAYRDHLETMVQTRTEALRTANDQLKQEIQDREEAEQALARLSHSHALILHSAGEGIFGVDMEGHHTFVNQAAAEMLGYKPHELIGKPSHPTWHHSYPHGQPYPESACPLHAGYKSGSICQGEDEMFWRRDGTGFPVRYVSTPIFEGAELQGAVVIFQDITEEKQAKAEITRRNIELGVQNTIAATISASLDLGTILDTALATVLRELDVDSGCILLREDVIPDEPGAEVTSQLHLQAHREAGHHDGRTVQVCPFAHCDDVARRAIRDKIPLVIPSPAAEPRDGSGRLSGPCILVGVPLLTKNRAVGAIILALREEQRDLVRSLDLLTAIGQQVGIAVENARLYQETERWAHELALLHETGVSLNATLDLDVIYDQVVQQALRLLRCGSVALYLWREDLQSADRVAAFGVEDPGDGTPTSLEGRTTPWLAEFADRRAVQLIKATASEGPSDALLGVPLRGTARPLGFLLAHHRPGLQPGQQRTVELAESFANLVSVVLEKAEFHRQAERAAALEERQRIAADMHDGLAQTLSYLGHQVDSLVEVAEAAEVTDAIDIGENIRQRIDQASQEVRHLIASLQSQPQPPRSLQELLQTATGSVAVGEVLIDFDSVCEAPVHIPSEQAEQVERVVHEALLNAVRHAQAEHIRVSLTRDQGHLRVTVVDDGRGFDVGDMGRNDSGHFGLSIMKARAARLAGRLDIHSTPTDGTRVELFWPHDDDGAGQPVERTAVGAL